MCTNGINAGQVNMLIDQLDDQIALNRKWAHKIYHLLDDNSCSETAAQMKQAQGFLDEARAAITEARSQLEADLQKSSGVEVKLV